MQRSSIVARWQALGALIIGCVVLTQLSGRERWLSGILFVLAGVLLLQSFARFRQRPWSWLPIGVIISAAAGLLWLVLG